MDDALICNPIAPGERTRIGRQAYRSIGSQEMIRRRDGVRGYIRWGIAGPSKRTKGTRALGGRDLPLAAGEIVLLQTLAVFGNGPKVYGAAI